MFCASCNLHFPDHLSFCRRCGQPLASSVGDQASDSVCCTRCGARGTRIENFCQQCGHSLGAKAQETVVGACYHCGTSWRSGWLFCKTCGLDRDRALLRSTSSPIPASPTQKTTPEDLLEIEKIFCKRCGTPAKPFSRFCETCGNTLDMPKDAPTTGKLKTPPAAASLRTQIDAPHLISQHDETFHEVRTTQGDPAPPPRIVRRIGPEAGRRKTVAIAEAGYTSNISDKTDRLGVETAEREGNVPHVAPSNSTVAQARRKGTRAVSDQIAYKLPEGGGRRRTWPIAAGVALALLAVATVIWWLKLHGYIPQWNPGTETVQDQGKAPGPATAVSPSTASSPQTPEITVPAGMVYVRGTVFEMGRNGGDESESPPHRVTIKPFFIDRTEVTNEQYKRFIDATSHAAPADWSGGTFSANSDKIPVVNVTWNDANAYAKWAEKRLPTEAEWEFAARGTDGRIYPWGNEWNRALANVGGGADGHIVAVGKYLGGASPFGALDMCGNVWEWTSSKLISYSSRAELWPGRVIRGGAFDANETYSTVTYRGVLPPNKPYP